MEFSYTFGFVFYIKKHKNKHWFVSLSLFSEFYIISFLNIHFYQPRLSTISTTENHHFSAFSSHTERTFLFSNSWILFVDVIIY